MNKNASATESLARFVTQIEYSALPKSVTQRLRECFLDFVGIAAFAAEFGESSQAFRSAVRALDCGGYATVIGDANGFSYPYAALLNGSYAHTLDYDDTNLYGAVHPGAPVIPAAMAIAEIVNPSGREFIEALAAGYEITCRVAAALGPTAYDRGFHVTSVAGIFGAVAAAAKLRKAGRKVVADAFGLALSQAAGSMQYLENGAWNKRLHPGFAAHDALTSLAFAEASVPGAAFPIEGRYGLLNGYGNSPRPDRLTDQLGSRWVLVATAIKPYPACRFTHAAIEAAIRLRERVSPEVRKTVSLQVRLSSKAVQIVGERVTNKLRPQNIVDAQFSVYFQVAMAWAEGRFDWQSYERLGSPDVEKLSEAIDVAEDSTIPFAGAQVSVGSVREQLYERIDEPLGEPQRPLSWEQLEGKFLAMAGPVYRVPAAQEIAQRILRLEQESFMAPLIRSFRGSKHH